VGRFIALGIAGNRVEVLRVFHRITSFEKASAAAWKVAGGG